MNQNRIKENCAIVTRRAFKVASKGVAFAPGNIRLTPEQLALLPDIAFDLLAVHGPGT